MQKARVRLRRVSGSKPHDQLFLVDRFGIVFAQQRADARVIPAGVYAGNFHKRQLRANRLFQLHANTPANRGQHLEMNRSLFSVHYALPSLGFINISRRELATTRIVDELCKSALIITEIPLAAPKIRPTELMAITSAKF